METLIVTNYLGFWLRSYGTKLFYLEREMGMRRREGKYEGGGITGVIMGRGIHGGMTWVGVGDVTSECFHED